MKYSRFQGVAVSLLLCFTNSEVLLLLRTRLTQFMDSNNINFTHLTLGNSRSDPTPESV